MKGNHFALKTDPVLFVRTGCLRRRLRKPRPTLRRIDARLQRWQRQPRKPVKRPWTIPWRYTLRKRRYNYLPSVPNPRDRPRQNGRKPKPGHLNPLNPSLWFPASQRWDGPALMGQTAAGLGVQSARHGWSSIPFINFISGVSRPQVFAQSREKTRESADWTGQTYVTRWDVKLYPKSSKPPEKRTITVVSSPARQVHVESAPEVPVPALVADGPAGADPAAGNGSDTGGSPATRNGTATGNCTATGNRTATCDGSDADDGPATGDGLATVDDPASDDPADVSEVESELQFDKPDETDVPACHPTEARLGTLAVTSPGDGPDVSRSTGTSSLLFPSIPRNTGRLYVDVDVTTASDGPVQCYSCSSLSSGPVSSAGSQTWLNQQEISHAG